MSSLSLGTSPGGGVLLPAAPSVREDAMPAQRSHTALTSSLPERPRDPARPPLASVCLPSFIHALSLPDALERLLEQHPEIGMVYGRAVAVDAGGRALGVELFRDPPPVRDPLPLLLEGNWICGSTVMARRECFVAIGLHDEGVMYSDWDLWIRIVA